VAEKQVVLVGSGCQKQKKKSHQPVHCFE